VVLAHEFENVLWEHPEHLLVRPFTPLANNAFNCATKAASRGVVRVIRTDEELMIVRLACRVAGLATTT
jgi:RNase P/RNase MRP subunit POP5